ncbi:hypothetical protein [Gemmatimonas sp.]|uniref:hypothetical protein n=2 Tax=Gemmatimonas sp. TaxID=1962908 RepID=UPI00286DF378|nr:hypothetical protein [Gemmatimonas sp.]
MSDASLRARTTTEIVDAAFTLYRRDFQQYIMVGAIAYSPMIAFSLLTQGMTGTDQVLVSVGTAVIGLVIATLVGGAVTRMGADVYLGGRADVGRTVATVLPLVPMLIVGALLTMLMVVPGLILLIVPGVYLATRLFGISQIIVLEKMGPVDAVTRSFALTKGRAGHVFLTLLLLYGLYFALSFGVTLAVAVFGSPVLQTVVSSVLSIFCFPILGLAALVLYYDLRIRNEGFDVEHMAQSLDGSSYASAT